MTSEAPIYSITYLLHLCDTVCLLLLVQMGN